MKNIKPKHGMKKISKLAKIHGAYSVKVGVIKGTGVHAKSRLATIAEIAWWNEFGTRRGIPERPFLRWTWRENGYYRKHMKQMLFKIMTLREKMDRGLKLIGAQAAKDVRNMITKGAFVPNAESTIRKKSTSAGRKSKPLIDTGLLRRSISYQLSSEMKSRMLGES